MVQPNIEGPGFWFQRLGGFGFKSRSCDLSYLKRFVVSKNKLIGNDTERKTLKWFKNGLSSNLNRANMTLFANYRMSKTDPTTEFTRNNQIVEEISRLYLF